MRILIMHSEPDDFRELLESACGEDQLCWATHGDEAGQKALEFLPEVIFSIKHSEFPGEFHRLTLGAPSVKWFHVGGSGVEHLGSWDSRQRVVTNSVGVLAPFHAEAAMAGLLALTTGVPAQLRAQASRSWTPRRFRSLSGRTLVVVGLGHTGGAVATLAKSFGMNVVGVRLSQTPHPDVETMVGPADLDRVLPEADVVSLNVRAEDSTYHLLNRARIGSLRPGCIVLNASRGSIVETEELVSALETGRVGGAWLDVFEEEPLPPDHRLWSMPNVLISAHCADQVHDFPLRFAKYFLEQLRRYRAGQPLENVVDSAKN